jgi:hypothetical protein
MALDASYLSTITAYYEIEVTNLAFMTSIIGEPDSTLEK